jgi:Holliday junction resolvasome RuvABC endonuclease subunit
MTILALDLGTNTGWAISKADSPNIESGCFKFPHNHFEGAGMRYLRFTNKLREWHKEHKLTFVGFEEVRAHSGITAAHVYGGFLSTLTEWCEKHGIPYTGLPVKTIKKHATGNGSASKEAMISAAIEKGHFVTNDNEADAIHIMYLIKDRWAEALTEIDGKAIKKAMKLTGENTV